MKWKERNWPFNQMKLWFLFSRLLCFPQISFFKFVHFNLIFTLQEFRKVLLFDRYVRSWIELTTIYFLSDARSLVPVSSGIGRSVSYVWQSWTFSSWKENFFSSHRCIIIIVVAESSSSSLSLYSKCLPAFDFHINWWKVIPLIWLCGCWKLFFSLRQLDISLLDALSFLAVVIHLFSYAKQRTNSEFFKDFSFSSLSRSYDIPYLADYVFNEKSATLATTCESNIQRKKIIFNMHKSLVLEYFPLFSIHT